MTAGPDAKIGGRAVARVVDAAFMVIAARDVEGLEHRFEQALDALEGALRDVWALKEEARS